MRLAVITAFRAGELISFVREVALVKSASLYADSIDVLSFSSLVYTDWGGLPEEEVELLRSAFAGPDGADNVPQFTTTSDRLASDSGVNELLPAVREGLITVNDRLPSTGDVWGAFVDEMLRYFNDPSYVVLLDDFLGEIAAQAIRQGRVRKEAMRQADSAEAVIGAGLIARLHRDPDVGGPRPSTRPRGAARALPLGRSRSPHRWDGPILGSSRGGS